MPEFEIIEEEHATITRPLPPPVLNVDLLDKTMDHIRQLEAFKAEGLLMNEHWDQGTWGTQTETCGTAMCFAGWAVKLAGGNLVARAVVAARPSPLSNGTDLVVLKDDGTVREVDVVAVELLGLTDGEETDLFEADNDLEDLEVYVRHIKNGAYR